MKLKVPQIILDTDPGGDDIFAFVWLLSLVKQGFAELIAVTSVGGNVAASQTFSSASQILGLLGSHHIEVGRAAVVDGETGEDASHIHGADGMGNLSHTLPPGMHSFEQAPYSDDLIIDKLLTHPNEITLIAIGPFTNLAAAETKHPGILKLAKAIILMAGAFHCPGNVTPHAEFNVWFNPSATQIVLNSRDDIVVIPLDITRHLVFTPEMAQAVVQACPDRQLASFLRDLCQFMTGTALKYRETNGVSGFLVHDAATVGYLFYPETMLFKRAIVKVETKGEWTRGQTLMDSRHSVKGEPNAWVALQVDKSTFFASLLEDLKYLIASDLPTDGLWV